MRFFAFIVLVTLIFILPSDFIQAIATTLFAIGVFGMFLGAAGYVLNIAKKPLKN